MLKKSQQKLNLGFSIFILLLLLLLIQVSIQLALIFAVSLAIGFTLQKSRFCFVAAFRDPLLIGTTKLTEALILLLAISIPGFAIVFYLSNIFNLPLNLYVTPFGAHTFIGGLLFGTGMVLAGGCASGTLMRVGEGFAMQMIALFGLFLGAFLGKYSLPYWLSIFQEFPGISLPDIVGWVPAVFIQLLILFLLWEVIRWWQKKQKGVG
ncbi:putative transporter component [Desulfitobacterium dehalogenans ATCC 51507]|uniref:Putative transporter component n=1 Tax=Desulfitobacterium dehalogenans (strain ATCC 51507 / DSM 9161 / JW/IU-DC1) TaxID=756499 RepID=I4A423_DESDJ|nr:YeeE/YedE thiosulfate transporter family protein [Desulfitobacterium dehalogenans]AFL98707.1 putative transporter component [Desulfitobacterium dehalogenans ATCC 51507]